LAHLKGWTMKILPSKGGLDFFGPAHAAYLHAERIERYIEGQAFLRSQYSANANPLLPSCPTNFHEPLQYMYPQPPAVGLCLLERTGENVLDCRESTIESVLILLF
jgi:hypothetical protein